MLATLHQKLHYPSPARTPSLSSCRSYASRISTSDLHGRLLQFRTFNSTVHLPDPNKYIYEPNAFSPAAGQSICGKGQLPIHVLSRNQYHVKLCRPSSYPKSTRAEPTMGFYYRSIQHIPTSRPSHCLPTPCRSLSPARLAATPGPRGDPSQARLLKAKSPLPLPAARACPAPLLLPCDRCEETCPPVSRRPVRRAR